MTQFKGRPFYQGRGKKHFYNLGDARGRQAARLKAEASMLTATLSQSGGAVDPAVLKRVQERYAGNANPRFIKEWAHILDDRPRMNGWPASKPSDQWRPWERAAYLRDGMPKNKEDMVRIMGTWGNPREY